MLQQALSLEHNENLKEKLIETCNFKVYYLGVFSRRTPDDAIYQANRELQKKVPRGLFAITNNNKILFLTHGTHKFSGMEDEQDDSVLFTPQFDSFNDATQVIFTEKSNGKMATFRLFSFENTEYCFLSSKTSCVVFPVEDLYNNTTHGEQLMTEIFKAFKEMWLELNNKTKEEIKILSKEHTFQVEFNDGKHLIPLEDGENPRLEFTVLIKVDNKDPSDSMIVSDVNGILFYDYLKSIGVPDKYLVKNKIIPWENYPIIKKQCMYTNILNKGVPTEGYVALICTKDKKVIASVKIKNISYILLRMLREHLKKSSVSCQSIKDLIKKRVTGKKAYPKLLNEEHRYNIEFIFCHFYSFLTKKSIETDKDIKTLLDFNINSIGMANLWKEFSQKHFLSLEDCFVPCKKFKEIIPKFNFDKIVMKRNIKKGTVFVDEGKNIPKIIHLIKNAGLSITVKKSNEFKNSYKIEDDEGEWTENNLIDKLKELSIVDVDLKFPEKEDDTWKKELETFFTESINDFTKTAYDNKELQIQQGVFIVANRKITVKIYYGNNPDKVWILQGPQGVGKTTIAEMCGRKIACADDYPGLYDGGFNPSKIQKAHKYCQSKFLSYLSTNINHKNENNIVVANTSTELWEMSFYAMTCYLDGFTVIRVEPLDDGSSLMSLHLGNDQEKATKIIKQKLKTIQSYELPYNIEDIIQAVPPKKNRRGPDITVVGIPYNPMLKYFNIEDIEGNNKLEFHVTLKYNADDVAKYPTHIQIHVTSILKKEDNYGRLECMAVKLYNEENNEEIIDNDKHFHITLVATGKYKPVDSNKLMSGEIVPDNIIENKMMLNGVVKLL
uniref:Uncharacterized protein n=1 Tax=viral metagenome TaxID=1070528 RepID=A0A6C0ACT1_9ZZZZ